MNNTTSLNRGFSLVELSIALVILGLLVGGVLTGQSLIRAAELRSVSSEFQSFVVATQTFKDKYFALPGDMTNATEFWGAMANCGANSPSGTGTQTCSGNGDGVMDLPSAASRTGERFTYWQQLANAGLIEGTYTGIAGTNQAGDADVSVNIPASKFPNGGWDVGYATGSGDTNHFLVNYENFMRLGAESATAGMINRLLTAEEAWNIDKKIDDGLPGAGIIIAYRWDNVCAAANANDDYDAAYNLDDTSQQCVLYFRQLW